MVCFGGGKGAGAIRRVCNGTVQESVEPITRNARKARALMLGKIVVGEGTNHTSMAKSILL